MATKESRRAAEIIYESRVPRNILGIPGATFSLYIFSPWIASARAHDAGRRSTGQSTKGTGAVKRAGSVCRINQQYLFPITMTPAYHWRRRLSHGKCHLFTSF